MRGVLLLWHFALTSTGLIIPDEQVNYLRDVDLSNSFQKFVTTESVQSDVEDAAAYFSEHLFPDLTGTVEEASDRLSALMQKAAHTFEENAEYVSDMTDKAAATVEETFSSALELQNEFFSSDEQDIEQEPFKHHHGHKSNLTLYQLISSSNYTTKLAKLVDEYDDLVELLNSTSANLTVFAPTDRAFAKIPKHAPKPSKKLLKYLLSYHISPEFYPAKRVLVSKTIPTLLKSDKLGEKPLPQRLSTRIGFKGLVVNFYSRVVAVDFFGKNGVIHGVDSIILPPPEILKIIDLLPSEFSTLELGLFKSGLFKELNNTSKPFTVFTPSNFAFKKLGPKVNAFLFSKYGLKYLKALLKYHFVPENVLYSDAFYKASTSEDTTKVPKGVYHVDLPTLLKEHSLGIDIARWGRFISIKINGFSKVSVSDAVARDGVIHAINDILIPPKKLDSGELEFWQGETEMTVEDLSERLEPYTDDIEDSSEML